MAEIVFWIAAVTCVIAEIAILRSTFASRRSNKSELVPSSSPRGEIALAVIPALVLVVVLTATWRRIEARQAHMQMMDQSGMEQSMPMSSAPPKPQS